MGDKKETLHSQIRSSLAILKYTGSCLVSFKEGKYTAHRRLYLFLPLVIIVLCNLNYLNILVTEVSTGKSLVSANSIVVFLVRLMTHLENFHCCIFVIIKSKKVADLLNDLMRIEKQLYVNYSNRKFLSALFLYGCVLSGNILYNFSVTESKTIVFLANVILEFFILSLIFQVLFFIHLTTMVNKQVNSDLESNENLNLNFVLNLRNVREELSEFYEKIQDVFGLAIVITLFNRALYVAQDVDLLVGQCLSLAFKKAEFADIVPKIFVSVIWSVLDYFMIITAVIVCSKAELEVGFNIKYIIN